MREFIMILCLLLASTTIINARDSTDTDPWTAKWDSDFTFSHSSFNNWKQSAGENQLNVNWYNDMRFVYTHDQSKLRTTNFYILEFTQLGKREVRKSDDRLEFESIYTFKIRPPVDPYAALTMKTQVLPGYSYPGDTAQVQNSALFDPGYLSQSIGFAHALGEQLVSRLGLSVKETFASRYARDQLEDSTKSYMIEAGIEFVTDYNQSFGERYDIKSKLEIFSTLHSLNTTDVQWKNYLGIRFTKSLILQLQFTILYDSNLSRKRQIKETTTIGFHYSFL